MRERVNASFGAGAFAALLVLCAVGPGARADEAAGTEDLAVPVVAPAEGSPRRVEQGDENRWVPSLSIMGGALLQRQEGFADSVLFEGTGVASGLQGPAGRDDLVVGPFVGASVELMSPALPLPWRPRLFVSGEITPTFSSDRSLVSDGDPDCVRGPEPLSPCAQDEMGERVNPFDDEDPLPGEGTRVRAEINTVVVGATLGISLPFGFGERTLRIKPNFSWITYEVEGNGIVVNATCDPVLGQCTDTRNGDQGFLRQPESLAANETERFHGIGPGFDLEMDTGRFGPFGSAIFLGGRFYHILGDRDFTFGKSTQYFDQICAPNCPDTGVASFEVDVDPWMYRAHAGIRFFWLGFRK